MHQLFISRITSHEKMERSIFINR